MLAARGIALAHRGSARDEVMREMVRRERNEKFATVQLFARMLGDGLRLDSEKVETLLDLYMLELSQDRYRPSLVAAARAARSARKRQKMTDQQLLDKVNRLAEPPRKR